jgi:hypothetical protein
LNASRLRWDSPRLHASTRVWAYTDAELLARMFREMADEWRGSNAKTFGGSWVGRG